RGCGWRWPTTRRTAARGGCWSAPSSHSPCSSSSSARRRSRGQPVLDATFATSTRGAVFEPLLALANARVVTLVEAHALGPDDDSTIDIEARERVPLGHKIAIASLDPDVPVLEYGIPIGKTTAPFEPGAYVHTHNLRSARW